MEDIKYIKNRWVNRPYDYIAIKCKGRWLFYMLLEHDCMEKST